MLSATGRFRRTDRILRSACFRRITTSGERTASRNFVVFMAADTLHPALDEASKPGRIGITVSKRVGNAVVRNHVKRRVRQWYRQTRQQLPTGAEIVVIARRPSRYLPTAALFNDLDDIVGKYRLEPGKVN